MEFILDNASIKCHIIQFIFLLFISYLIYLSLVSNAISIDFSTV